MKMNTNPVRNPTSKATFLVLGMILASAVIAAAALFPPSPKSAAAVRDADDDVKVAGSSDEVYVQSGTFYMGCASDLMRVHCDNDAKPVHVVYLDAFLIDRTEVTNAQYASCVRAGACPPPTATDSATRERYYGNAAFSNYPVLNVFWNHANAYCKWQGKRLPTEAEWEKAARGPDMQFFPWGNNPTTCELANIDNCVGDTVAVGSYPQNASPYGALDMIGNVREWVSDLYKARYYATSPYYNPKGPETTDKGEHLVRGGGWLDNLRGGANPWVRIDESGIYAPKQIGFRCARSAPHPIPTATPLPTPTPFVADALDEAGGALWLANPDRLTVLKMPGGALSSSTPITLTFDGRPNQQGDLQGMNHFFRVETPPSSALQAADSPLPGAPGELTLGFRGPTSIESGTLRLYRLGPTGWMTQGITITGEMENAIDAQIIYSGVYGLLGRTNRLYLPITARH